MKILCFIDSLGSGGAQRQLTALAVGLKKRGHEIRFLVYHQEDHFLPVIQDAGISCRVIPACPYWQRVLEVRRIVRRGWQDVVLAFLEGSCFYAELACLPYRKWGLVVGERLADPGMNTGYRRWWRQGHRLADSVVTNSHTNRLMLEHQFPALRNRLTTVYNTVDLELFRPAEGNGAGENHHGEQPLRIVVAASYQSKKNMTGLAKALLHLRSDRHGPGVVVDWYGATPPDGPPLDSATRFVQENGLADCLHFHGPTPSIQAKYVRADAVGLFSFFEGLPNVICEGMACGKPILLSNVCDADNLVADGRNGFLCDPGSPESIAAAIGRMAALPDKRRLEMGYQSRTMAEGLFSETEAVDRYERILVSAAKREAFPPDCMWPAEVPGSAASTIAMWAEREATRG